jgi:Na+-driven multidrug efflux pump
MNGERKTMKVLDMTVDGVAIATSTASMVASIVLLIKLSKSTDGAVFSFKKLKNLLKKKWKYGIIDYVFF